MLTVWDSEAVVEVGQASHLQCLACNTDFEALLGTLAECLLINSVKDSNELLEEVDDVVDRREGRGVHVRRRGRAKLVSVDSLKLEFGDEDGLHAEGKHVSNLSVQYVGARGQRAVL